MLHSERAHAWAELTYQNVAWLALLFIPQPDKAPASCSFSPGVHPTTQVSSSREQRYAPEDHVGPLLPWGHQLTTVPTPTEFRKDAGLPRPFFFFFLPKAVVAKGFTSQS